jgi:hypothetical protein
MELLCVQPQLWQALDIIPNRESTASHVEKQSGACAIFGANVF